MGISQVDIEHLSPLRGLSDFFVLVFLGLTPQATTCRSSGTRVQHSLDLIFSGYVKRFNVATFK